mgnify:CR=1 FL=1
MKLVPNAPQEFERGPKIRDFGRRQQDQCKTRKTPVFVKSVRPFRRSARPLPVIAGGGQPQDPQCVAERTLGLSMFDRKQQVGLGSACGQTPTLKQSPEDSDQSQ